MLRRYHVEHLLGNQGAERRGQGSCLLGRLASYRRGELAKRILKFLRGDWSIQNIGVRDRFAANADLVGIAFIVNSWPYGNSGFPLSGAATRSINSIWPEAGGAAGFGFGVVGGLGAPAREAVQTPKKTAVG